MEGAGGYSAYDGHCSDSPHDARPPAMRPISRSAVCCAYVVPAVVLLVLAVAACGNEAAPTSGAGGATSSTRSTAPREAVATQIPPGPATAAFLARARAVEQAVRAAGIPKSREGIFLYSDRTPGLGFDTVEQKVAWGAGHVSIAPGVPGGSGGPTRIDFGDGTSLSASVLDPRTALTQAIGTPYDNCGHMVVPASKCQLVITAASLKTADVDTSNGRATVPAWSFTAKGLSRPIVVLAVSTEVLQPLVEPVPPPGLGQTLEPSLVPVGWLTGVDDRTLTFVLDHESCDRDLRAHVLEFNDMVVIGGSRTLERGCGEGVGASTPATVTLAEPLGDRAVISAATGARLTLYPHLK